MKRGWIVGFLMLLVPIAGGQEAPEALWHEGNTAYREGDFQEAVAAYEAIRQQGVTAPALEYNLGNAYLKAGSVGRAVLHYRRALHLDPGHADARRNLAFARQRTRDLRQAPSESDSWLSRFGLSLALSARLFLGAVSLLCMWGIIRLLFLRGHMAATLLTGVLTGFALLTFVGLMYEWSAAQEVQEGVILAEQIEVRSGPGEEFTVHFQLHEGSEVELVRRTAQWREIRISDELQGWIPVSSVAAIE